MAAQVMEDIMAGRQIDQQRRIKMILPVPMPPEALAGFARQIPPHLVSSGIAVDFVAASGGGALLDSYYEATLADAFVLEAGASAEEEGYSAVCVNSMSDSGLSALRSLLTIPVVGPGAASLLLACMLGKKFSILTMWDRWTHLYDKVLAEQGLTHRLASIRSIGVRPDTNELLSGKEEFVFPNLEREGRAALEEDGADVLILGSTTMYQAHEFLAERLSVPVLNPGLIAFKLCETLLDLGLSHSKLAYRTPERLSPLALEPLHLKFDLYR
jgi:allantoin racemase